MELRFPDSDVCVHLYDLLEEAETAAGAEVANTGGALQAVHFLHLCEESLQVYGTIPINSLADLDQSQYSSSAQRLGKLHLVWASLFHQQEPPLGYLVLQRPLVGLFLGEDDEDASRTWVRVEVPRVRHSTRNLTIGVRCCMHCCRPIPLERVRAVPDAYLCVGCKSTLERKENSNEPRNHNSR